MNKVAPTAEPLQRVLAVLQKKLPICAKISLLSQAYNLAKGNTHDYPGIADSTAGILFLGTPHRGTGEALHSQGRVYQAVVRAQYETQEHILQTLEPGNDTLVDVVNTFTRSVNVILPKIEIFCFYEQKPTAVGRVVEDNDIKVGRLLSLYSLPRGDRNRQIAGGSDAPSNG
jgi:hypothetical protein